MTPKILWVLLPLLLYAVWLGLSALRGRAPSRLALNIQTSLLLVVYLLTTAGLGIFWVANQQLPVFDIHYLFGYATLLLVSVHLFFNLPMVFRWLRRKSPAPQPEAAQGGAPMIGKAIAILLALGLAFFLGTRHGSNELSFQWNQHPEAQGGAADAVVKYHEFSAESRGSVFKRAPGVEWGAPPVFKSYPDARRIDLERGQAGRQGLSETLRTPATRTGSLTLAELGEILYLTAGVTERRGGTALRASPSSGALFPNELYLLARRIDGLAAGIYHYDPEHHRLHALGPLPATSGAPAAEGADATMIATAIFRRTGYKYRNRAYRYVVADTGHLLENLRIASHKAGMQARLTPRFDEALTAKAIGIDGEEEGVLAVMDLRPASGSAASMRNGETGEQFTAAPAPAETAIGVTGMVHRATSLKLAPEETHAAIIALPPPVPAAGDVHHTITHRRSKRRFLEEPVPLASLSSMLADMALPPQVSNAIRVNLVINRVAGLRPGIYRYLPKQHALVKLREGNFAAAAESAALSQEVIGDAAVTLILSADRQSLLAEGARGYRQAFIEAGMMGERWLLGAVARGLGACPVGAFYDDEAATLIGVDRQREWVLHFAALGLPTKE